MKPGARGWSGAGILTVAVLFLAGCGGGGSTDTELSSGNGNGGGGTGITNTFSSPAEMGMGDIMPIEFGDSTEVTVDFSGVASGANFILILGSNNTTGSGTTMQLATDIALADGLPAEALVAWDSPAKGMSIEGEAEAEDGDGGFGPQEILSAWLRAAEDVLPDSEMPVDQISDASFSKAMTMKAASVGQTETFRVLANLTSTTTYVEVTGKIRCVGSNVVFYVDTEVPSDVLSDDEVNVLCSEFDGVAGDEVDLFGAASDVDADGKVHILMTKQINRLGALGGGIVTGYFYAGDLYARSESNPASNHREIVYTMVPDPNGQYGTAISNAFAMSNLLPAVLPHELQHAINYNQHVFVNGGPSEENWLNEGLSHLAEDLMGYGVENPSRYAMHLASPSTYGVVTQGSPNLMERGAAYLFLRFLYEQAQNPEGFIAALVNTPLRGVTNLETAFAGPAEMNELSELMARWVVALAMTDRGLSQDGRYIYRPRVRNSATGNWEGVCLECDPEDNRGTQLEGVHLNQYYGYHQPVIDSSAAIFYDVTTLPNQMSLSGSQGGGNFGVLIRSQ